MNSGLTGESRWAGMSEVLRMSLPIIIGTLSFTFMQFIDQMMVARLGKDALAAVGSAGIWSHLLAAFFMGVIGCVNTFSSQSLGRNQFENCSRYAWQGVYLAVLTGAAALLLWPFSESVFGWMGHSESVTQYEVSYFRVRLFGYVFIGLQSAFASFFLAVRTPKVPMFCALFSNTLNIGMNYLLIFGKFGFPRLEVRGAALATVASLGVNSALLFAVFLGPTFNNVFRTRHTIKLDFMRIGELFRIGAPAGITGFLDLATWSIFTSVIVGRFGTVELAAHVTTMEFLHLSFMPAVGIHMGLTAIVGQWIGREDIPRAKARTYTAMKLCIIYMTCMGVFLAVFAKPLTRACFSTDPEVVELAQVLLIFCAVFQAFDAVNITAIGALRGAGDTLWMSIVLFVFGYFVFIPMALLFSLVLKLGVVGAWLGATVYIIGISGLLFWRFYSERWRRIRIFKSDRIAAKPPPVQ